MIKTQAVEESTAVVTVSFFNAAGTAVTPTSATWTLTDKDGTVINNRNAVTISSLSTSVTIVLSGDDLRIADGKTRKLLVQAIYSSTEGDDLPLNDELEFQIQRLVGVS
jgi:hypothetical protein